MKILICIAVIGGLATPAADWPAFGNDPQRTGWAKSETQISVDNVTKLHVEWSLKLENAAKELNALTVPIIVENAITPKGFKDIVLVAGSSDTMFAIDADTGKLLWNKQFQIEGKSKQASHWLCPNALNATPVIDKASKSVYTLSSDGKLHTLNYVNGEDQKPPVEFVPPFAKTWSLNLYKGTLSTTTSQGCNSVRSAVYTMNVKDPNRPVSKFVAGPAGGAGIWGRAGCAVSSVTGLIYAETGDGTYDPASGKYSDTVVAVSPEGKLVDYYTPANRAWISKKDLDMGNISPMVFPYDQWELVAGAGKEGVIYLLDAKSLGGADHRTPLFRSSLYTNDDVDFAGRGFWGSFAGWKDAKGVRWLYAPAWGPPSTAAPKFPLTYGDTEAGSIMAFTLATKAGKPVLEPAWISRDLSVPEPPIIANGLVFALSNGENVRQVDSGGRLYTSKERADAPSGNTILYAFNAETGKELYSSGSAIPTFTHFSGLAISNGRVYVVTHDSTVYAFGLAE
ncbi:MAG: PQQ-binding-like beta-propeller repeat protein [Bryobacteraceae bacterium]